MNIDLVLNIEPKAQSRPRFARHRNHVATYEDPKMKSWRRQCTALIADELLIDGRVTDEPLSVTLRFYIKPPKYLSSKKKNAEALKNETIIVGKKPDLDNYIKAVLDSISDSQLVWKDDGQVAELHAIKMYSMRPRIEAEIREVEND